jgi:exopolysaccharide biosynthesis polyprenyl glycosylphosphotransferase
MPVARFFHRAAVPVIGLALAVAIRVLGGEEAYLSEMVAPLVGAWLVMALGAWVEARFDRTREVTTAVIGTAADAAELATEFDAAGVRGYRIVGWIDAGERMGPTPGDHPYLGGLGRLRRILTRRRVELLVLASSGPASRVEVIERIADACLSLPVRMIDADHLYEELLGHVPLGTADAAWFEYLMHPRYRPGSPISKRTLDCVLGSLAAILTVPVVLLAWVAIRLTDRHPALLRQRRVGAGGREFTMLKLRTMRPNAEAEGDPRWCEEGDPRVTRVGRWLRRTHVDELPQLINVLRGEMSLVGPRPERPGLVADLERSFSYYDRRHLVRPGITGWAQVRCGYSGDHMGSAWKLCHDLYYVKHRSTLFDLAILLQTLPAVGDVQYGLRLPNERFIHQQAEEAALG